MKGRGRGYLYCGFVLYEMFIRTFFRDLLVVELLSGFSNGFDFK